MQEDSRCFSIFLKPIKLQLLHNIKDKFILQHFWIVVRSERTKWKESDENRTNSTLISMTSSAMICWACMLEYCQAPPPPLHLWPISVTWKLSKIWLDWCHFAKHQTSIQFRTKYEVAWVQFKYMDLSCVHGLMIALKHARTASLNNSPAISTPPVRPPYAVCRCILHLCLSHILLRFLDCSRERNREHHVISIPTRHLHPLSALSILPTRRAVGFIPLFIFGG